MSQLSQKILSPATALMERVRSVIESGLPEEYRHGTMAANSS